MDLEPGTRAAFEINDDETCTLTISRPGCPDLISVLPTAVLELVSTVLPALTEGTGLNQLVEQTMTGFSTDPDAAGSP